MAVDAVTASTAATATGRARLAENFDTFLSLLTTQLRNQDPLSPLDSNEFTAQLVQMTGVEQQLLTNDLLEKLVANTGSGVSTAVALIGKEVRAASDETGLANGKAEWIYKLDRAAADVKVEILDSKGRVVKSIAPTNNSAGEHTLTWDGKSAEGSTMPDGTYTLRVTATDSSGSTVPTGVVAQGVVTGVQQIDGQTYITINGAQIPWETITLIRQAPETTPPAETASTGSNNNPDDGTSSQAAA